jgi:hypothetical protein
MRVGMWLAGAAASMTVEAGPSWERQVAYTQLAPVSHLPVLQVAYSVAAYMAAQASTTHQNSWHGIPRMRATSRNSAALIALVA